jgi:hypothetical protein
LNGHLHESWALRRYFLGTIDRPGQQRIRFKTATLPGVRVVKRLAGMCEPNEKVQMLQWTMIQITDIGWYFLFSLPAESNLSLRKGAASHLQNNRPGNMTLNYHKHKM